jgi:hypothetical protein
VSVCEEIIAAMKTALEGEVNNDGYSSGIKSVTRMRPHYMTKPPTDSPTVEFFETGREEKTALGGGYARYRKELVLKGWATTGSEKDRHSEISEDLHSVISRVSDDCKFFVKNLTPSNIHPQLLDFSYQGSEPNKVHQDGNSSFSIVIANLTYVEAVKAITPITVTGSAWIDEASDLLYARLAGTGLTRYQRHDQAWMTLPAVTVGFEGDSMDYGSNGTAIGIDNNLTFTVRVHAAYGDGFADSANIQAMLNSVINALWAKINLQWTPIRWRIGSVGDVQSRILFEESDTIGGQVTVVVNGIVEHTQE